MASQDNEQPGPGPLKLTDDEVATLASSANTKFEEMALELSKRIEEVANTVPGSE